MHKQPLTLVKVLVFSLFIATTLVSCSQEDLLANVIAENAAEEEPDTEPDVQPIGDLDINTTPCDYTLDGIAAGTTLAIECQLDLDGKTVSLPTGVTLEYKGGEIINGTLNFTAGGKIDGNLLNQNLTVEGNVSLISETFEFHPSRWDIVQGDIVQSVAYSNHVNMQNAITSSKNLGAIVFSIGKFDAYFDSEKKNTPVIELPSDFHFAMSADTHLRIFPVNREFSSWMIRIRNQNNIKITGGSIHGDRKEHGSTPVYSGVLVWIMSGIDILVENVNIINSAHTGLTINSYRFHDHAEYNPSRNVKVTNCYFDANAANNVSITDGKDIIIENCELYRAGINLPNSLGIAPRIGIVIEPVTGQKVDGVIIRNNIIKETGGKSSILAALGNNIIIEGNDAEKQVGWTSASNVKVINNPALRGGVIAGFTSNYALSKSINNVISGNTMINCKTGIYATNDDIKIFNNKFINCTVAMLLRELQDTEIYDNEIESNVIGSFGINAQISLNNVTIRNNNINLTNGRAFSMSSINSDSNEIDNKFIIKDNTIDSGKEATFTNSNGIDILNNIFKTTGVTLTNSKNILFQNNNIVSNSGSSLYIGKTTSTSSIQILDNFLENTNSDKFGGYGLRIASSGSATITENVGINVEQNTIKVKSSNYGIYVKDVDGLTINSNKGTTGNYGFIYFRGDNSEIINNEISSGTKGYDIVGVNNVIYGNN
ncbi:hypothetical protein KLA_06892 [Cellulophaga geojensis KL-A]|uniref:Periplasmic copper-binding protein NosD beta helix domain-containing protein n=1 Tax=Cellulophaga geojensis KL-A TaxID=1328323 RepID=A0ABN0RQB6_9FLAO|nr:right-handed parallel beta-helix repeat-containing protein [Cellulophaga geojensis]EWH14036.1 hypothetical protein KLA_06892 [Cellulophaga geojensis KL-A]